MDILNQGRESFRTQKWADAHTQLLAAHQSSPLDLEDLERLAVSADLTGKDGDSADFWARAHHECLRLDNKPRAARCAFWLALSLLLKGEMARGGGWLSRAQRLLEGLDDCAEHGWNGSWSWTTLSVPDAGSIRSPCSRALFGNPNNTPRIKRMSVVFPASFGP